MRPLVIGGSDAGIRPALRPRELQPTTKIAVLLSEDFPSWKLPVHTTLRRRPSLSKLPSYFKGLVDENRQRILNLLVRGELCGCAVLHVLGTWQSTVSRHLSFLENAGLVLDWRAGYRVFNGLVRSRELKIRKPFEFLEPAFKKDTTMKADRNKLHYAIQQRACTVSEWQPISGLTPKPHIEGA